MNEMAGREGWERSEEVKVGPRSKRESKSGRMDGKGGLTRKVMVTRRGRERIGSIEEMGEREGDSSDRVFLRR